MKKGQLWSGKKFGVLSSQGRVRRVPGGWCLGCKRGEPELCSCPLASAVSGCVAARGPGRLEQSLPRAGFQLPATSFSDCPGDCEGLHISCGF